MPMQTNIKFDKSKVVAAWQASENAFVIACASSKGGVYLVGITTTEDNRLVVAHDCPAIAAGYDCWHTKAAIELYKEWYWWKPIPQQVVKVRKKVVLSPNWVQIPIWREQVKREVNG